MRCPQRQITYLMSSYIVKLGNLLGYDFGQFARYYLDFVFWTSSDSSRYCLDVSAGVYMVPLFTRDMKPVLASISTIKSL